MGHCVTFSVRRWVSGSSDTKFYSLKNSFDYLEREQIRNKIWIDPEYLRWQEFLEPILEFFRKRFTMNETVSCWKFKRWIRSPNIYVVTLKRMRNSTEAGQCECFCFVLSLQTVTNSYITYSRPSSDQFSIFVCSIYSWTCVYS